jgi:sarcosine oxidase subunit gamma
MKLAGETLGIEIPKMPCRASVSDCWATLWLGPDERLLLGSKENARAQEVLENALAGIPHSLVDVGHRQVAIEVSGTWAEGALNSGCPLELAADGFPVGMCTRTVFAKSEIVLWRKATNVFHVEVARSFAVYVSSFLTHVAQEFDAETGARE